MDFSHTEERRLIEQTLTRWLRDRYDLNTRRQGMDEADGFSTTLWRELGELGMISALLPVARGGLGGTGYDIALVFEQLGHALAIEPWLSSALMGARLFSSTSDPENLLPSVLDGSRVVAVAHNESGAGYATSYVETQATEDGEAWRINGKKVVVLHANAASHLLVSARTAGAVGDEHGLSLFLIDATSAGVGLKSYVTIDGFPAADLVLEDVVVPSQCVLGGIDDAFEAIELTLGAATLAICAEALGAMQVARDMTLDYLRTREQFGQPIGKFQALQHRMVDVATAIEQSRSLVIKAASVFDGTRREREEALSAAKYYIGEAGRKVSEEAIQMHGGIGIAGETPINHYAKRLVMIDHYFGDTDYHLDRYIAFKSLAMG